MTAARPLTFLRKGGIVQIGSGEDGAPVLCLDLSASSMVTLAITHADLDEDKSELVVRALEALAERGTLSGTVKALRFVNVGPTSGSVEDRNETVRRHDRICALVRDFCARSGHRINDAYLVPNVFKFDTLVFFEH